MTLLQLDSPTRDYPWGSLDGLSRVLGRTPSGAPEAELWMGAHASAPSLIRSEREGSKVGDLGRLLHAAPELLGKHRNLPFLFKVLSAAQPLSLQAHPNLEQARAGFARENAAGVPVDAPHRNYKDANHKPELIFALTEFEALCGFVSAPELRERFARYGLDGSPGASLLLAFEQGPERANFRALFEAIFQLDDAELSQCLHAVRMRAEADNDALSAHLVSLLDHYGCDPGVLGAMLLNHKTLKPGEALFVEAGVLHSYLRGTGLEIMAASDNVLRGGLTKKHVDLPELVSTLCFDSTSLAPLAARASLGKSGGSLTTFAPPVDDFQLSIAHLQPGGTLQACGPHVVLVLDGAATLSTSSGELRLVQGGQAFCAADEDYRLSGNGRVAIGAPGTSAPFQFTSEFASP